MEAIHNKRMRPFEGMCLSDIDLRDEQEGRGESHGRVHPRHRDRAILHRLSKRFQRRTRELRQFVEKEDSMMSEADLPRPRIRTSTHDRSR